MVKVAQDYNSDLNVFYSDDVYMDDSYADDLLYVDEQDLYAKDKDDEDEEDKESDDEEGSSESKLDESDESKKDDEELVVLELDGPSGTEEFSFVIPDIPGALDLSEIPEPEIEVKEEEGDVDPWDWKSQGHGTFLNWLQDMVNGTPRHSGKDISGLERAISYFELLLKEISKAMRTDYKGEIDVNYCEGMRDGMEKSIEQMNDRLDRLKKYKYPRYQKKRSWMEASGITKEAQKVPGIAGITIVVPLFISRLARTLVNGTVSAGHSMEDMYDELVKKYKLTEREEAELQQLLADMGYPIRQDRGMLNEQVDKSKSDNFDFAANYKG